MFSAVFVTLFSKHLETFDFMCRRKLVYNLGVMVCLCWCLSPCDDCLFSSQGMCLKVFLETMSVRIGRLLTFRIPLAMIDVNAAIGCRIRKRCYWRANCYVGYYGCCFFRSEAVW